VIVDNDARSADATGKILAGEGFVVSRAESVEHFFTLLETISPDVVLLDVRMPGLNGDEALPRILTMKPKTKVIILTGHGEERAARRACESGAFDYLCKPCDVDVLVARIHDAVRPEPEIQERERTIAELMIPIDEYTCVQASSTVREGIERLKIAAENFVSTGLVMECGHRAVLHKPDLVECVQVGDLPAGLPPVKDHPGIRVRHDPHDGRTAWVQRVQAPAGTRRVADQSAPARPEHLSKPPLVFLKG